MRHIQTFQVFPRLPESLSFLGVLSRNMWWSWNPDAIELFRRIDPRLWETSGRNPIVYVTQLPQERLQRLALDDSFLAHLKVVREQYKDRVLANDEYAQIAFGENVQIAYFSMEFGIHESLPLFAGGLGVLAGDHLKSASHSGIPLVAVGLMYREGYFHQFLDLDGWQQEDYPQTDYYSLPLVRAQNVQGKEFQVQVTGPQGKIIADVWKIMIGRVPLFLLDTNLAQNPPEIRGITARLYSADHDIRLAQEVLLGVGGIRALAAMGIEPAVCHMNEGHSAFANIERLLQIMSRYELDLNTALQVVARTSIFTTHTPVAAGHDEFSPELIIPYLKPLAEQLQISENDLLSWGQINNAQGHSPFSMFILGLRFSQYCNGVSKLHGQVARRMWSHVWPQRADEDTPITHITNGVHISSFISLEIVMLFDRYLGPQWRQGCHKTENTERIDDISDEELWRAHEMSRTRLISKARDIMVQQYGRRNASPAMLQTAEKALNPHTLTIGFARRFTTYKRANLIFREPEQLIKLLTNKERPVQIIIAGKAHPHDNEGKELIKNIVQFARRPEVRNHVVFLEDYDMHMARHLVQGVDVWLNTPRRPMEACGTSGMKAAANGVLNVSILDGWWCEGYSPERGWAIGNGEEYADPEYQDAVESQAFYNLLENDVIPCFYNRSTGNMPTEWIAKMKASMKMAIAEYCSHCMITAYEQRFYLPAVKRRAELLTNNAAEAKKLSVMHQRFKDLWKHIHVGAPERTQDGPYQVDDTFDVQAKVHLGEIRPEEVDVELYYGRIKKINELYDRQSKPMTMAEDRGNGDFLYRCTLTCSDSGRFGFTVRVVPRADDWIRYTPGLLTWA